MFWNPLLAAALAAGGVLYWLGVRWAGRRRLLGRPGASFILYYLHLAPTPWAYIAFRSLPGCELLAAAGGLPAGPLAGRLLRRRGVVGTAWHAPALAVAGVLIALPFLKPILLPAEALGRVGDAWDGPAGLQTTPATCGPAPLATSFAACGQRRREREIARACYSCASGTELWYLLRDARRHGLQADYIPAQTLVEVPVPALVGVALGNPGIAQAGHFIAVIARDEASVTIADPLTGRQRCLLGHIPHRYRQVQDVIHFHR